jgi:peptide/nickel transport system permease protein
MAWHLVLPVGVMIFVGLGSMIIYVRSLTLEILKSDYYYFALSRGLDKKTLLRYYILPNLIPPIVTLLGLSLPGLIGGSVILESIFGIEGMGQLFFMSALSRDYPIIMGTLMITAFLTLLGNMIADLILVKLNPYMKRG